MRFAWCKLAHMVQSPQYERPLGLESKTDQFFASEDLQLEAVGELLLIRGKYGVEVTSLTNLVDARELVVESKQTATKGRTAK